MKFICTFRILETVVNTMKGAITFRNELLVNWPSTKETKRLLSHLSPTLREGERLEEGAVKATIAECGVNSGGLLFPGRGSHITMS